MQINVIIFGQLCDLIGESLTVCDIYDTESLKRELNRRHPSLEGMKYAIAVNKKIVTGNIALNDDSVVALLPPFSGG